MTPNRFHVTHPVVLNGDELGQITEIVCTEHRIEVNTACRILGFWAETELGRPDDVCQRCAA